MSVLLAKPWTGQDPTGWWMSEKLDGIRAIWRDGELWSRNGKRFYAPAWFKELLPPGLGLDGELFVGRGQFDQVASIVRAHSEKNWDQVGYRVFDLYPLTPEVAELRFEKRQELVRDVAVGDFLSYVKQQRCEGIAHLQAYADSIYALKGEGVMLRQPKSLYEKKRSGTLLKVTRFFSCEVRVTGQVPGKGKHLGRLGALDCVTLDSGIAFQVGTGFSDAERENPPKVGDIITIRFREYTKAGVPRFPVYVAVRDYE